MLNVNDEVFISSFNEANYVMEKIKNCDLDNKNLYVERLRYALSIINESYLNLTPTEIQNYRIKIVDKIHKVRSNRDETKIQELLKEYRVLELCEILNYLTLNFEI